jgi:hypothetical protein
MTLPDAFALSSPALTRARIIARSNSGNTPHIWNMALPAGVDVQGIRRGFLRSQLATNTDAQDRCHDQ